MILQTPVQLLKCSSQQCAFPHWCPTGSPLVPTRLFIPLIIQTLVESFNSTIYDIPRKEIAKCKIGSHAPIHPIVRSEMSPTLLSTIWHWRRQAHNTNKNEDRQMGMTESLSVSQWFRCLFVRAIGSPAPIHPCDIANPSSVVQVNNARPPTGRCGPN